MQLIHRSRSGPDAEPEGRTGSGPAAQGASGSEDGSGTGAGTGSIAGARTAAGVSGRITWAAAFALNAGGVRDLLRRLRGFLQARRAAA